MVHLDEDWMGTEQTGMLASLAASTSALSGEVVEIGSWQGRSAMPIANAVAPATLHIVDHWKGDGPEAIELGINIRPESLARDNYSIFLANMNEATAGNYQVWKMDWRDFIKKWGGQPIRFVHLDAEHTEDETHANIEALLPLVVPGGVVAGDDFDFPGVGAAVRRHFPAAEVRFNKLWWTVI